MQDPKVLLEHMVMMLVDRPEAVVVDAHIGEATATFEIHVDDSDVGKVLGRHGAYADAFRLLFGAAYSKLGKRLQLQVIEPRRR